MRRFKLQRRRLLRQSILDSARELFVRYGYETFTMRRLAEQLGCSHGNLYLYFTSKQQLFDALVETSFAQLAQQLAHLRATSYAGDPVRMLKEAGRIYIAFGRQNPSAYEFAFVIRRSGPARPYKPHAAFGFLRDTIGTCIEEGRFRKMDVDTATQAVWAAVHGVTSLLIARPNFPWVPTERLIEHVIDSAVEGLLAAPRRKGDPKAVAYQATGLRRRR